MNFKLKSKYKPSGDQPQAIEKLAAGVARGMRYQTLLGVTGSGKTFTVANVIARVKKPTLVIAHNKTLAAQLCNEYREFFPENAVEYFVSYYDYYQPEAYLPHTDTYIEKEADINDEIDRLRHAATQALLTRRDVIIVASVSCIYGLGAPETYEKVVLKIETGRAMERTKLMRELIKLQFNRTNADVKRGQFRARGNIFEIMPVNQEIIFRVELGTDEVADIQAIDPVSRKRRESLKEAWIFPAKHFITLGPDKARALKEIRAEMEERLKYFNKNGLLLEAERLERRTRYDLEMMNEIGYCSGIENYSRHLAGRKAGEPPDTLISYFPEDFLMVIDESHVTVPQVGGMYNGDRSRKKALIDHGFRLPSAYDNRPLTFSEFEKKILNCIFTSATPGPYEMKVSGKIVEQIIRPTGLVDPEVTVRPVTAKGKNKSQVEDLINEVKERTRLKERSLVTTLTKKMAEDLSDYLLEQGIKAKYLHSGIDTLERIRILTSFRKGQFDCLVGVNLLREGLDLPEVTLVAIMDADKEGFLRSATSLVQTIGRAARNVRGEVILYADEITGSMRQALGETNRRRKKQAAYNKKYGITPRTIKKKIKDITKILGLEERDVKDILGMEIAAEIRSISEIIADKERQMKEAAAELQFELAAVLRDEIKVLKKKQ
ncbi:MAG: excinuclease ABC subunit UvrB [Patescibacteria group bacterium]|nr:excinuclease ABC subunit UvrB [Patescibacteria group bacterium]